MKKLLLTLIIFAVTLTACTAVSNENKTESAEQSVHSSSSAEPSREESAVSSEESSISSEESSVVSSEESSIISAEESSEEKPSLSLQEITGQIASITEAGFNTNIENATAAEAMEALRAYLENSGYGYFYCDLEYNGYVSYGCDRDFKTASTSKLPYIKYLCTLADKGAIDLTETKLYEQRHKTDGSGVMKNMSTGASFTIATLMDYVLRYSDNIAYSMLMERFGLKEYLESVAALGVDYHTVNGYTNCTAAEMAALLYDTALYSGEQLSLMKNAGCNASYNYQIGAELKEYDVLQKYGAIKPGNVAYHDIAVVYAPHPYILVIYTTIDYNSANKNIPFRTIARLTDDLNKALYGE